MTTAEIQAATLAELAEAEAACTRCPLYRDAIHAVPGEGPTGARLLVVGEQPGDMEDREGKPFVGPAGRVLDEALETAGIPRDEVFVTNAVKHFKHQMRGKRRLHKRPNTYEIDRCKWWLDQERSLVAPATIIAMGTTAIRSLLGRPATITSLRGRPAELDDGTPLVVTIHPSSILRIREHDDRVRARRGLVDDLQRSWELATAA